MDDSGLQAYLHEHIPMSRHIGVRVLDANAGSVRLLAPLEPNLNHRRTGFGGSISALAILAGWSLLWCRLGHRAAGQNIVIQSNSIDYLAPVTTDFIAECVAPNAMAWARFHRALDQRGRGRVRLETDVIAGGEVAAKLIGQFVVLDSTVADASG